MKKELVTKDDFWAIFIISVIFLIIMLSFSIVNYLKNELLLTKIDIIKSELTEFPDIRIEQYKDNVYVCAGNKCKIVEFNDHKFWNITSEDYDEKVERRTRLNLKYRTYEAVQFEHEERLIKIEDKLEKESK